jgi:hypothetical protein
MNQGQADTVLRCSYCGQEPPPEKIITEGMYKDGHLRALSTDDATHLGYPEDPCGPLVEVRVPTKEPNP